MLNQYVSNGNLKIALGDKVKVKLKNPKKNRNNLNIGTVLFYGLVEKHEGTYFGISFDSPIGKNNGTYKKRKYFECKKNHGCFVHSDQIIKIISPATNNYNIRLYFNSTITLPEYGIGKIQFAGLASFNPGIWYGIFFNDEPPNTYNNNMHSPKTSKANGVIDGIKYFKCNEGHAIFRRSEDLYSILTGTNKSPHMNKHVNFQNNIKPSLTTKHHSNTNIKNLKPSKPKIKKSESVPYKSPTTNNTQVTTLQSLIDLSNELADQFQYISDNEIQEYNNDHSNETKEDGLDDYDSLKLQPLNPSDDIMDSINNCKPRKNTGIMIAESDTSDIDDNLIIIANNKPKNKQINLPSITVDDIQNPMSAYLEHVHQQNVSPSPKSYTAPAKSRKSIKKLKSAFKNAVAKNKNKISTPAKFGQLSLEYSTSSPTEDIDNDDMFEVNKLKPSRIRISKSVPHGNVSDSDDEQLTLTSRMSSQSARTSPTDNRDRALTFPTMALNTDNASKVSAATPNEQTFKVVILGQSRVGKTSIIRRFVKDKFFSSYKMTINAVKWQFKCEVPIDLYEHIEQDKNMLKSMTSFFGQSMDMINEETNNNISNIDPFDEDDKNAEFGDDINYDYGQLNNMEQQNSNNLGIGLFDYQSNGTANGIHTGDNASITDYGEWTIPELDTNNTDTDTRKISMKLQITIDIIDMGFHATKEESYHDVNAIILVIDSTKKSSIQDAIDKYEAFLKHSAHIKSKKRKRKRSRSQSNANKNDEMKREYIPLLIAVNRSDVKKTKKQFKKRDVKQMIYKKLLPIIDQNFPESDDESDDQNKHNVSISQKQNDNNSNEKHRKPRNFSNQTWLQPPNLSIVLDDNDKGSDSEFEDTDDEEEDENNNNTKEDLLSLTTIYHKPQISSQGDPFNTPRKKRKKKSSKKMIYRRRDKNDIRYIDIIQCSAKTGQNIEQLFDSCIKKTIPSKLTKSVAHKRTKTTAHVTAPIWLRQVVAEFQNESNDIINQNDNNTEENLIFGHMPSASQVDDNFRFLGDDDKSD